MCRLLIVSGSLVGSGIRSAVKSFAESRLLRPTQREEGPISHQGDLLRMADELASVASDYQPNITAFDASSLDLGALFSLLRRDRLALLGRLVVLTPIPDEELFFPLLKWGISAYLPFGLSPEQCRERLRQVFEGSWLLSSEVFTHWQPLCSSAQEIDGNTESQLPDTESQLTREDTSPLTKREREVLTCVAHGLSNKGIGRKLKISDQTVKNYITSILKKLKVNDRTAAAVTALLHGWIKINPAELSSLSSAQTYATVA